MGNALTELSCRLTGLSDLTSGELARRLTESGCKISRVAIYKWRNAQAVPRPQNICALAALLGLSDTQRDELLLLAAQAQAERE